MCLLAARGIALAPSMNFGRDGGVQRNVWRASWGEIAEGHARPDKQTPPWAFRPYKKPSLPKIAGMAHSTLKSGAATRMASPSGIQLKIPRRAARPRIAVLSSFKSAPDVADYAPVPVRMD